MKERSILFKGPMVRAILDGRKTVTRRLIPERLLEEYYEYDDWCKAVMPTDIECSRDYEKEFFLKRCPYGGPGDMLWVREAFSFFDLNAGYPIKSFTNGLPKKPSKDINPIYRATMSDFLESFNWRWWPSIHMPKWVSRINLEVKSVRPERLQDITEEDIKAEGINLEEPGELFFEWIKLWDSINGKKAPWSSNPWVWPVKFEVMS